jgi:hypothetical protein
MEVKSFPSDPTTLKEQDELRRLLLSWLSGQSTVAVDIKPTEKKEK